MLSRHLPWSESINHEQAEVANGYIGFSTFTIQ